MTSLPDDKEVYTELLDKSVSGKKLFYIKEALEYDGEDANLKAIIDNFKDVIKKCVSLGMEVHEESISRELLLALYPSYMAISCAEATSNDANLTGIHFGNTIDGKTVEEIITNTRTNGFSGSIKRRFIIGSYILNKENQDRLFLNACRLRRMIVDKMNLLFKKYDAMILPTTETVAPRIDEKIEYKEECNMLLDRHLIIGNFGGYPSITIPCGICGIEKSAMPIGLSITGNVYNDSLVLNIANKIQEGWFRE
jgi:aspartyl-tRNA(Asn)/glutamyl-tRNA(Gln) amidotransferase subunit A